MYLYIYENNYIIYKQKNNAKRSIVIECLRVQ
jgi:hypothetical protein